MSLTSRHGPAGFDDVDPPSTALVDACVHCGFCLPSCPTYLLWNEEMDSPRGRIYLMKAAIDGRVEVSPSFVRHFDACLGCMACVTACPSGVRYGPLVERTRGQIERRYARPVGERMFRWVLFHVLPSPAALRVALAPLALVRRLLGAVGSSRLCGALPGPVRAVLSLAPRLSLRAVAGSVPERTAAVGSTRLRVGLLAGCVQRVVFGEVNRATVRVLAAEGCEVLVPREQGCCGALSRHAGRLDEARSFARRTIQAFENAGVDRVVTNAAGCGSSLKEYGDLLADDPQWTARARAFAARVRDVSELLAEAGEPRAIRHAVGPLSVAYHDACHLAHAQQVRAQPRELLKAIPGVTVVEIAEPDICCGSAGIYNIVQPGPAAALGDRKARHITSVAPDLVATGNPGCSLQLAAACRRAGMACRVVHPIELLDASIRGASIR